MHKIVLEGESYQKRSEGASSVVFEVLINNAKKIL